MNLEEANEKLYNIILDIINKTYNHPTAYDVYLECVKVMPNISLGTVYRNLGKLVERREIQRFELKDNIVRYDKNVSHDHFICVKCSKVIDLNRGDITYNNEINGNVILDARIFYDGICCDCLKLDKGDENNGIKRK